MLTRWWRAARARPDAVAIGLLALLPFLFLWDFVLARVYLFRVDFKLQWLPWQKFVVDSLRHGQAPFWNPYLMLGFSQVGESQVGMFYPVNLLTDFLDLHWRSALIVCLHLALANVSTYLLLRYVEVRRVAALIGAVSYGLSGYMFAQVTNYVIVQCSAYLPLMLLLLAKYHESGRPILLAWFSLVAGLDLLISHAGTTFMLLGGSSIFFVAMLRARPSVRPLLWYGGALALVLLFAAVQVFPSLELQPLSERGGGMSLGRVADPRFITGFENRLSFFFPWLLGSPRGGRGAYEHGFEEMHQYAGAFTPVLAAVAGLRWRRFSPRQRRFLGAVAVMGLIAGALSLGPKFPWVNPWVLLARLPLFSMFRIPARWGCLATFALSIGAAFGVDALLADKGRTRTLLALGVLLPAAAVSAAMLQEGPRTILRAFAEHPPIVEDPSNAFERLIVEPLSHASPLLLYLLVLGLFVLVHAAYRRGYRTSTWFQWALLACLTLDLFVFESPVNPRAKDHAFFDSDQRARYFDGAKRYCRVATPDTHRIEGFPMNVAAYFGIFSVAGDTPLEIRRYMQIESELPREDLFDYLGACYRFERRAFRTRRHPSARAFLVRDLRPAQGKDPLDAFLELHGDELRTTAYLLPGDFEAARAVVHGSTEPPQQHVEITRYENSLVELGVRTSEPGLLVLTDLNYPGWSAKLDGRDVRLLSAQGAFRSVVVPAGSHRVRFEFHPRSVYLGALVTALSLFGFAAALVLERRKARTLPRLPESNQLDLQ
jgi:hypothetical protein